MMPRLIEAEALAEHKFVGIADWPPTEAISWQRGWNDAIDAIIANAPTVDAISIEWILNNERMPKDGKGHDAIMDMIEDWRKENR